MLDDLYLNYKRNACFEYNGSDSFNRCFNKKLFQQYPWPIVYQYNSRGFRDQEWPTDLSDVVWCLGDSFTVGLGSPLEHTWWKVLESSLGRRCVNVSMDGASNEWLARKALAILSELSPVDMVIMWSYTHRRENWNDNDLKQQLGIVDIDDEDRRSHHNHYDAKFGEAYKVPDIDQAIVKQDSANFQHCVELVETNRSQSRIIHSFIPGFRWVDDKLVNDIANWPKDRHWIPEIKKLDLARDGFHFDIKTSRQVARSIVNLGII